MSSASQAVRKSFARNWFRLEVAPLICIMGTGIVGTGWYLKRLCGNVDAVWDRKNNPYPWQNVDQDTNLKLYAVNKDFKKSFSRDRF